MSTPDNGADAGSNYHTTDWSKGLLTMRIQVTPDPFTASYLGTPGFLRGTDPHSASAAADAAASVAAQQQASTRPDPTPGDSTDNGGRSAVPWWISPAGHFLDKSGVLEGSDLVKEGSLLLLGVLLVVIGAAALVFIHRDTISSAAETVGKVAVAA